MFDDEEQPLDRRSLISRGGALLGTCLLASAGGPLLAKEPQKYIPHPYFDVKTYGATGKRADNATKAFRDAIDACSTRGGGTVNVPPGDFTVGKVELKDNVTLHLEAGATLFLSQLKDDFGSGPRAMIFAENRKNIAVTGNGTLDGLAQYDYTEMQGLDVDISEEIEIAKKSGMDMRRYYRKKTALNAYMFVINDCIDFSLLGVTITHSPLWTVKLSDCDRVFIRGVHIYSDLEKGVNADGIDICSSSNVTISDSVIETADDSIVLKTISRKGKPARPIENVTVTNCILTSSSTPLMIGTETEANIRHVLFNNCVIRNSNKGFGINVQDGATVSDVVISNLTIETNRRHWNWWGSAEMCKIVLLKRHKNSPLGRIHNVLVQNIVAHTRGTSIIAGHEEQPIENISITNVKIIMNTEDAKDKRATHAFQIGSLQKLRIRDLSVEWDVEAEPKWKSALVLKNVSDFVIDSFWGRQGLAKGTDPAVLVEDCQDGAVIDSKASDGTGTFIHIKGNSTAVKVRYCDTEKAVQAVSFENESLRKGVRIIG